MRKLYYCKVCGTIDFIDMPCAICGNHKNALVPEMYLDDGLLNEELKNEFIENVVKKSPNFDKSIFDRKDQIVKQFSNDYQKIKAVQQQASNIPKCPTCGSTNIRKMRSIERGASILTFGIFSKKINKTFKCNNCGYTW